MSEEEKPTTPAAEQEEEKDEPKEEESTAQFEPVVSPIQASWMQNSKSPCEKRNEKEIANAILPIWNNVDDAFLVLVSMSISSRFFSFSVCN